MRCPQCGQGRVFVNKSVFPLGGCLKAHEHCSNCGMVIKATTDSAPSINYALSVIMYVIGFVLYAVIFGITYKDNSFYYSFFAATMLVIVTQPWLLRYSKVLYLYLFLKFYHKD